jgi:hypothetical protein
LIDGTAGNGREQISTRQVLTLLHIPWPALHGQTSKERI